MQWLNLTIFSSSSPEFKDWIRLTLPRAAALPNRGHVVATIICHSKRSRNDSSLPRTKLGNRHVCCGTYSLKYSTLCQPPIILSLAASLLNTAKFVYFIHFSSKTTPKLGSVLLIVCVDIFFSVSPIQFAEILYTNADFSYSSMGISGFIRKAHCVEGRIVSDIYVTRGKDSYSCLRHCVDIRD